MAGNTIGRVAEQAGVGVETVRFYQRRGLIEEPETPDRGFRVYPEETIRRILFIRRAKALGFSLGEIGELLNLRVNPGDNCSAVKAYAEAKIEAIDEKLDSLGHMKNQLERLTAACDSGSATSCCAILDALE